MIVDPRLEALGGLSPDAARLAERLDESAVVIRATPRDALLAVATANVIARLIPSVEVTCRKGDDAEVNLPVFGDGRVTEVAARVVEHSRLARPRPTKHTLTISTSGRGDGADLHVSASTWSISLGRTPLMLAGEAGPATTAASALAAAEVVRQLVPDLPGRRLGSDNVLWNLLDYRCTIAPAEPVPGPVDAVCFGGGSVGSSMVYALLLGEARGSIAVVDPDKLTARNRVRYPMLLGSVRGPKAMWLESVCRGTGVSLTGLPTTASQFVGSYAVPIQRAIATVDSASARRDVADALARNTLNAGVSGQQFHVSRHAFDDGFACVYCAYLDVSAPLDGAGVYSEMCGLPSTRVRSLLDGDTLTEDDVDALVQRELVRDHERREFEGARLQDVIRRRPYAQAEVRVTERPVAMAAPYVSALAGSILAAELHKDELRDWWLDRRVDVDCSGYPTGIQSRPLQDASGRCLCRDPYRQRAYREMWPA